MRDFFLNVLTPMSKSTNYMMSYYTTSSEIELLVSNSFRKDGPALVPIPHTPILLI